MTPNDLKCDLEATLDWVNALRAEQDTPELTKLAPGIRSNAAQCPITNSIPHAEETLPVVVLCKNDERHALPGFAQRVLRAFDSGYLPELEDSRADKLAEALERVAAEADVLASDARKYATRTRSTQEIVTYAIGTEQRFNKVWRAVNDYKALCPPV